MNLSALAAVCVTFFLYWRRNVARGRQLQAGEALKCLAMEAPLLRSKSALMLSSAREGIEIGKLVASAAIGILFSSALIIIFQASSIQTVTSSLLAGIGICTLAYRRSLARQRHRSEREIDFFLPIVMERLVMAVEAGLDVLSALRVVVNIESVAHDNVQGAMRKDRVTEFLSRICQALDAGASFEESLRRISSDVQSPALRHAFMHLALAHKEGGELIMPLRELSSAMQLYYQDSVEEEIAKLPAKATIPLLCTFTGLIICFITTPILRVTDILGKAKAPYAAQILQDDAHGVSNGE